MKKLLSFLLIALSIPSFSQEFEFSRAGDMETYQNLLKDARDQEKLLLVALIDDEDTAWNRMDEADVFEDPELVQVLSNFKGVEIPISSHMGIVWIDLFPVGELPAMYFLNTEEILINVLIGFQEPQTLAETAKQAYEKRNLYIRLGEKYSAGILSIGEWQELLEIHSQNFPYHQTQALATEFLNSLDDSKLMQNDVIPVLTQYGTDLETRYPKFIIRNRTTIEKKSGEFDFADYFSKTYSYNLDRAVVNEDSVLLKMLVSDVLPYNPDTAVDTRDLLLETQRLYVEESRQFGVLVDAAIQYYSGEENDSLQAEGLFEEGYFLADNYELPSAYRAARRLAHEANSINPKFRFAMLEGYMAYLLKDFEAARKLVTQAKTLTSNPIEQRNADGLMEMIEAREGGK